MVSVAVGTLAAPCWWLGVVYMVAHTMQQAAHTRYALARTGRGSAHTYVGADVAPAGLASLLCPLLLCPATRAGLRAGLDPRPSLVMQPVHQHPVHRTSAHRYIAT